MKRSLLTLLLSYSATIAADIDGTYSVSGRDPYKKTSYTGSATITKDQNDVYQISWTYDKENSVQKKRGTGIKIDRIVSFVFASGEGQNAAEAGVQVYKIKKDTLEGPFVLLDRDLVGTEKLIRQ